MDQEETVSVTRAVLMALFPNAEGTRTDGWPKTPTVAWRWAEDAKEVSPEFKDSSVWLKVYTIVLDEMGYVPVT
jgi:hypothetical protein